MKKANWTTREDKETEKEKEFLHKMSISAIKRISEDIDWNVECNFLVDNGWKIVHTQEDTYKLEDAHIILNWAKENCKGLYKARGNKWVFEKEADAMWFALRWL